MTLARDRDRLTTPSGEPFRTGFCNSNEHAECTADWCQCECHEESE